MYENYNMLFSKFLTKFCMSACRYMEIKNCGYDAYHMTKMAAISVYGKNPSKFSSP